MDADVALRILTCLVNIHSLIVMNRAESPTKLQSTALSPMQNDLLETAAVSTVYCFDDEYLQRLHEKLRCLCEHNDSRVQDAALRLIHLCE